jgi:Protein of unknown function (DUF4038)/Putative collagen-binding domain of a collagenase
MSTPLPRIVFHHGDLRVSADQRSLAFADGTPFFWLGDTAWELLHRLTRDEITRYLDVRSAQGFTVIQVVALAEFDGLRVPTPEGHLPLIDLDPCRPDPGGYWEKLDWLLSAAEERGLLIALLPTWGDKLAKHSWGLGPEVFTPDNAAVYGRWLGARLRQRPNLVWVVGGDRSPIRSTPDGGSEPDPHQLAVWRAMAEGLAAGDDGHHLMTFHPWGQDSSGQHVHHEAWLDFNGQQNGHKAWPEVWDRLRIDRERVPTKPVLDLEPLYEGHPIDFDINRGLSSPWHVRWYAWVELLAGTCGHTYGCHAVWQCASPRFPVANHARPYWEEALLLPGATQMQHARRILTRCGFPQLVPDESLLVHDPGTGAERIQAARHADGRCAVLYSGCGRPPKVDLTRLNGTMVQAWWCDPASGEISDAGLHPSTVGHLFVPPCSGPGSDWVLILDAAEAGMPPF